MTLLELLQLMRKHLKLMIVLPIVCALATAVVCFVALPNTYTASTSMYVLAKQSSANYDNAANYSNLDASQMMANVIDQATAPTAPSGPNRPMYIAVALLAGLFVAIAIVVVSDMLNTKVRNADEIEDLLGLPVIGRMPALKGGK